MSCRSYLFCFLSLVIFTHAGAVLAQAQDLPDSGIRITPPQLEEVRSDRLGNGDVVREDDIISLGGAILPEALENSTSVFVQSTTPGQASPFIRGLTGSSVLSLVDGMRLNHAMYRSAPNQDLALIDPYMIESLTVLYGPNSVRYGSDALGGVVYARTRQVEVGEDIKARAIVRYDTADLLRAAHSHIEASSEKVGVILGATVQEIGNRVAGGDSGRLGNSGYSSNAGFINLAFEPNSKLRTNLSLQYLRQPETPRFDELVAGYGQEQPSSDEFFFKPNERFFTHITQLVKEVDSSFLDQMAFDLSYQRIRDDRQQRDFGDNIQTIEENHTDLFEIGANADLQLTAKTELSYGIDATHDTVSSSRTKRNVGTGTSETVASRFPDDSTRVTSGVFSFIESQVTKDLSLSAGVRYSYIRLKLAETEETLTTRFSVNDFSWSSGLRWSFVEDIDFVSSISRGFRAPNVFDMGALGPRPGGRFNIANTNLDPEELYSFDVGVQTQQENISADLQLFLSHYNDRISSDATGEFTDSGRQIVQSQNIAESVTYGAESSVLIVLLDDLDLKNVITWTWGENKIDGQTESGDRIPPLFGTTSLQWRAFDGATLEPYIKFAHHQNRLSDRDIDDPRINPDGTPGWLIAGLRSSWEFSPGYTAVAALNNIGDKNYRVHGSGIDAAGRSVMLMLDVAL